MLQRARVPSIRIKPQFLARELAVLAFNQRVLAQAQDRRVPALERLRFLCILSSNLDEFFEIRVAELKERIRLGNEIAIPGETPSAEVFPLVSERTHTLVAEQLEGRDAFGRNSGTAIVQAPRALPRVIQLPKAIAGRGQVFVLLTSILQAFVQALFQGMTVRGSYPFRVTRNSDLFLDEEEIKNLR